MPRIKVSVRVPLWGSTISQSPTSRVASAQATRTATVPTEWAEKAAAKRTPLTTTSSQPMKIAVPTEATAGTRIAITPSTIAATPTNISAFQLRLSPSRTSGLSDAPPISMEKKLAARADAAQLLNLAVAGVDDRVGAEPDQAGRDQAQQGGAVGSVREFAQRPVETDRLLRVVIDCGFDQAVADQGEDDPPRHVAEDPERGVALLDPLAHFT